MQKLIVSGLPPVASRGYHHSFAAEAAICGTVSCVGVPRGGALHSWPPGTMPCNSVRRIRQGRSLSPGGDLLVAGCSIKHLASLWTSCHGPYAILNVHSSRGMKVATCSSSF